MKTNPMKKQSFDVKDVNNGTRNLPSLYDGVFIALIMGQREEHRSVTGIYTLTIPF